MTEISCVAINTKHRIFGQQDEFKEKGKIDGRGRQSREPLGPTKRQEARNVFNDYVNGGYDIYTHNGAGHEDQFIEGCGIDPSRIVNTYNMIAQMFPNLSPSATGKNQGTFLNASLFWTSFF